MAKYNYNMEDVFGKALLDYQNGAYSEDIITYSSLDEKDSMPLPYLFRNFEDMPPLEQKALTLCRGKVLDVGCGAGSHSLYLEQKAFKVTAIDISPGAVETCRMRGLQNVALNDIYSVKNQQFDTLLLLMNGIGIAGHLRNLNTFLSHLKSITKSSGQILVDSTDIAYMFEGSSIKADDFQSQSFDVENYYGEVEFVLEYKGEISTPFPWLYLNYPTLEKAAKVNDLSCELVFLGRQYNYLARLRPNMPR